MRKTIIILIIPILLALGLNMTGCNNNDTFDLEALIKQADRHLANNELAEAYTLAKEMLEADPNTIIAYWFIASAFLELENYLEAHKYITEAEKRIDDQTDPDEILLIYTTKVQIYLGRNMFEGTHSQSIIDYLEKVLAIEGISSEFKQEFKQYIPYTYLALGTQYLIQNNNPEKSLYYMQSMLEHVPENKHILYALATLSFVLKDFEQGMTYFDEYLQSIESPGWKYYGGYFIYYFEKEEYDKAYEYIQKSLNLIPGDDHYTLGGINRELGRYDEAIGEIEKAKEHYRLVLEYSLESFYNNDMQEMIKRLDLEVDDLIEQIEKERELAYSRHPLQY